jgi:hypothetical protein
MNRASIIAKIQALLSKTTENGCTEAEELSALNKAAAMRDAYAITDADLALSREEEAIIKVEKFDDADPHGVKWRISHAVSVYCRCQIWRKPKVGFYFCGLKSDCDFAAWLLDHLTDFAQAQLVEYLIFNLAPKNERRRFIRGFVDGITMRISDELLKLAEQSVTVSDANGKALVVIQDQAIAKTMEQEGIKLRQCSGRDTDPSAASFQAGHKAGGAATFGRPVSGAGGIARIGRQ